ncbi:hypothetical protein JXA56_02785 [Candidatus Micrarchaeota archaeon]|nr:hypothetical protein [Candidatus Micrarchaeota archaeon]
MPDKQHKKPEISMTPVPGCPKEKKQKTRMNGLLDAKIKAPEKGKVFRKRVLHV